MTLIATSSSAELRQIEIDWQHVEKPDRSAVERCISEKTADITDLDSSESYQDDTVMLDRPIDEEKIADVVEELATVVEELSVVAAEQSCKRRSILRCSNEFDDSLVKNTRWSWKSLPPIDIEAVRRVSSMGNVEEHDAVGGERRRSAVRFGSVHIRNYEQTLGDNPSVSYGPPIALDWDYTECEPLELDLYEGARPPRRKPRQLMLNYYARKNILCYRFGVSEDDLKAAEVEANRTKRSRALTRAMLPASKLEEVVEAAARKTKKAMGRKKLERRHTTVD